MANVVTSCVKIPSWISSVFSKIAQFDVNEFDYIENNEDVRTNPVEDEVRKFYQDVPTQVINKQEWVKGGGRRPIAVNQSAKNRANKAIHKITQEYRESIPLNDILLALSREGFVPLDENGSRFGHGMLVGDAECGTQEALNQRVSMKLAVKNEDGMWCMTTSAIHISWCTLHNSKKYEVVAYIG